MSISRSTKIILLLVIDVLFFFVELIVGYAVGSLALVADSFHMLNDVMSLIVALYAIKLSASAADSRYSYGWHRAEILAALVNGVFLLALCFSIFLESLERFISPPEISNPKVVVIVGSLGLVSNIVGLFLFHDHSHDHGPHPSAPSSKPPSVRSSSQVASPGGPSLPTPTASIPIRKRSVPKTEEPYSSLYDHPAATRAHFVQAAQEIASAQPPSPTVGYFGASNTEATSSNNVMASDETGLPSDETTPLLRDQAVAPPARGHGHSHSDSMNMRALVLHVLGDALGNVGVIASGLIIWLTAWPYKYYSDPLISLVITIIIFSSALPLVRSTSFILLQGVPHTVSLEQVRRAILSVDGVLSLHELHIWQLSENKIVASVHVLVASKKHDFMPVAASIRRVLHLHGIHSSTIQPEYRHDDGDSSSEQQSCNYEYNSCLLMCPADQVCNPMENACCPPVPPESNA